jgi:hypothetical protein
MLDSTHIATIVPVSDIETAIEFYEAALRERGVVFKEYDLPDVRTEGGTAAVGEARATWCKDADGNILAVESAGP